MKGFDEIAAEAFQRSDDGKWIFFPLMRLFGGFEVPSEERKLELQAQTAEFLEITLWLSLAVMFVAASLGRMLVGSLAMQAAIIAGAVNFAQRHTRFLIKSPARYDSAKRHTASIGRRSIQRLAGVTALCIVAILFAGYAIQLQPQLWGPLLSVTAFVGISFMLWARISKGRIDMQGAQTQVHQ